MSLLKDLRSREVDFLDFEVVGVKKAIWVYNTCPKCGYNNRYQCREECPECRTSLIFYDLKKEE